MNRSVALIFDLDGLLIDTEILYFEATRRLIRPYGYDVTVEEYTAWVGRHVSTAEFLEKFPLPLPEQEVQLRLERELYALLRTETQLMPGVREFLETVAAPYPRAIASATARPLLDELLELTGLARDFPIRVSAQEVPRGKPAPDVFLEAARRLERPPWECVVFEDSPFGIQGAHTAGMRTVAVPNLFTRHCDFSLADRVVGSLLEITPQWLASGIFLSSGRDSRFPTSPLLYGLPSDLDPLASSVSPPRGADPTGEAGGVDRTKGVG